MSPLRRFWSWLTKPPEGCGFGWMCHSNPRCRDTHCPGHPRNT